jgi:hypothetical protein
MNRDKKMAHLLYVLGEICLSALGLMVIVSWLIFMVTRGFGAFWAMLTALSIRQWGLIFILALPGISLLILGKCLTAPGRSR